MSVGKLKKALGAFKKPHFKKDLFLLVVVIPAVLLALFLFPPSIKDKLILHHDTPSLVSFYTTNFIHEESGHLVGNYFWYFMFVIPVYLLSQQIGQRKKFWLMMGIIFGLLPWLVAATSYFIPASETFLSLPASKSMGFSGIVSALFGILPYFTLNYLKKSCNWKTGISGFMNLVLLLSFILVLPTYFDPAPHKIVILLVLIVAFSGLLIKILRNPTTKACFKSAQIHYAENRFFRPILFIYIFGLAFIFPESLRIGKGIIDINAHLIGFAFGFVVSYLFVRGEFKQKK